MSKTQWFRATEGRQVIIAPLFRQCLESNRHTHLLVNGQELVVPEWWTIEEIEEPTNNASDPTNKVLTLHARETGK
jgi:hypothetical protein